MFDRTQAFVKGTAMALVAVVWGAVVYSVHAKEQLKQKL